ncbi:hypothetical protein I7I48_06482 [Histoplasma ohiense]|nr:hypothetical protein I7I48_06482 [Histoplasma ohiense (nom. inval.)]
MVRWTETTDGGRRTEDGCGGSDGRWLTSSCGASLTETWRRLRTEDRGNRPDQWTLVQGTIIKTPSMANCTEQ